MLGPTTEHPVLRLISQLRAFGTYPPGVRAIDDAERVRGTAFFPGGFGLWDHAGELPPLPRRPVMVLGHNFGDPEALRAARAAGREDLSGATWRSLLRLFGDAGVSPSRCFFTNACMGLRDMGDGCVGSMSTDRGYRDRCVEFLGIQVRTIDPGCILVLGTDAMGMLRTLSAELEQAWRGPRGGSRSIKDVRGRAEGGLIRRATFACGVSCGVAIMYHPCEMRNLRPVWSETVELIRTAAAVCGL